MRKFQLWALAILLAALTVLGPNGLAQTSNGTLVGTVTDQSGAIVPNATVQVTSAQYGVTRQVTTDSAGTYRMDSLQPGTYVVSFSAKGFADVKVSGVILSPSVSTTVNAKLQVGAVANTVTVEAAASQVIDTQSGQLGESLGATQVENLPYGSLNPAELAMTLPGVQDGNGFGFSNGVNYSVNGTRPRANNFLIDGQDDNDYSISGQAYQPTNVGAIQSFTVLTNSYDAEFGRGGGSVGNYIYKSGSNSFHGQAWEIHRNSDFAATDAATAFVGGTKPVDIENTFGFDIGGPAIHDKLFFFGTAQWDRERSTANGATLQIPTAAGVTKLQSLLPNSNVSLLLAGLGNLVAPSDASGNGLVTPACVALGADSSGVDRGCVQTGGFQRSGVAEVSNARTWNTRLDYHAGENDTLTGSYIRSDLTLVPDFFNNNAALPAWDSEQGGPSQLFRGQWTHQMTGTRVNELRFSYTNIGFTFGPTPGTAANPLFNTPEVDFDSSSALPSLGFNGALPQGRAHKTWQAQDAVSVGIGRHTIKGGIDLTFLSVVDEIPFNSRGSIAFNQGGGFTSLGNFVDDFTGQSGTIARVFGSPITRPNVTMYMPYIQDTWRVRDNFSLDLGLRYEYWGQVENTLLFPAINSSFGVPGGSFPSLFSAPQQANKKNFGPRISVAYTPHWGGRFMGGDKTVFRAGYGIFYDGLFTNILDNTAATPPNATGGTIVGGSGRGQANAFTQLAAVTAQPNPFATVDTISSKFLNPRTEQWNLNIQRELPGKMVVTAAYVGTRGEHLFVNQDLNPRVNFGARVNPNFGEIVVRDNGGDSIYHAGQLEVERRFSQNLIFRGSYTYSKFLDDGSEVFTTTGGTTSFAENLQCQKCDFGPSAYDRRHRFVASYVWTLPYTRRNSLLKWLTDRYTWSGIATIQSGAPNTIVDGFDNIGNGHPGARPQVGNSSVPLNINTVGLDGTLVGLTSTPGTIFGPIQGCLGNPNFACNSAPASAWSVFIPAAGGGNVGRNSVYGPGQFFLDMNVQRTFPIPVGKLEGQEFVFRAEAFNVLNHANLFTPTFDLLSSQFAETGPTISGGRTMKFWLTYQF